MLFGNVVVFEDNIQVHYGVTGLAGLLKEARADFEIIDSDKKLECVVTVPCLFHRSSGKLKIQVEIAEKH